MKDITKGDLITLIDDLPARLKNDKYRMASSMLPEIQNWVGGIGKWCYKTRDGELGIVINVFRTEEYQAKIRREQARR